LDPLAHVKIPTVPTLAAADAGTNAAPTNSVSKAGTNAPGASAKGTNSPPAGTNVAPAKAGSTEKTNTLPETGTAGTNPAAPKAVKTTGTNLALASAASADRTNMLAEAGEVVTNGAAPKKLKANGTNVLAEATGGKGSNLVAQATNGSGGLLRTNQGTNVTSAIAQATNATAHPPTNSAKSGPQLAMGGTMPGRMGGPPGRGAQVPPEIQGRVDRITESEILAPIMHPLPMALLGIAGKDAFLRAPNGQTGLVKEGEELGGIKILRIGTNHVLIQQEGQKKELTIFDGFGGESLLPKDKEHP